MCTRQGNFLLYLNLPCLRECKMSGLHGTSLLSVPMIFALPNCFGPGFLRTSCPLSLSLPVIFTFRRRLTIHLLHPLADLFLLLRFSSCCFSCFIRRQRSAAHLACCSTKSFACCDCTVSNHCINSQRGGGDFVQQKLES